MSSILLKDALCVTLSPVSMERADLRVAGGVITERGPALQPQAGETVEDLGGKIVMPGLVCAHTHLYSSLARGMPGPEKTPSNFLEILHSVWWRLDRALDADTIYCSAIAGALEAARCGVTTIVDHHASPNAIGGSLDLIRTALSEVGLRGILCYETSDRDGMERRDAGLAENEQFIRNHRSDEMYRGLVGAHASFTLSDESLRKIGDIAERHNAGVHIHLAEAESDPTSTMEKYGKSILDRFAEMGILRQNSVFAHCIHLGQKEFARLRESKAWLVHNPRSNMNNRVGQAPLRDFGTRLALGTDGFPPDMFEELRAAFFKSQESTSSAGTVSPDILANGQELVSELFGRSFGALRKDAPADLVIVNYAPPTPMRPDNLASHFMFGFRSSMVESVIVNGRWILQGGSFVGLNERELMRRTTAAAERLWSAIDAIRI